MKKERKADNFLPKPVYPGGPKAMVAFIGSQLRYPEDAQAQGIQGTVRVRIEIDFKGKVVGSRVMSGLSPSCDTEACRVAEMLNFEVDQKLRRGKIRFHKNLNIHFHMNTIVPQNLGVTLNYEITSSASKSNEEPSKGKPKTYSYDLIIKG
jgi:protein TonB